MGCERKFFPGFIPAVYFADCLPVHSLHAVPQAVHLDQSKQEDEERPPFAGRRFVVREKSCTSSELILGKLEKLRL